MGKRREGQAMLLSAEHITRSLGARTLLEDVSLYL